MLEGKFDIICNNSDEFINAQKLLFSMCYSWSISNKNIIILEHVSESNCVIIKNYSSFSKVKEFNLVYDTRYIKIFNKDSNVYQYKEFVSLIRKSKSKKINNNAQK